MLNLDRIYFVLLNELQDTFEATLFQLSRKVDSSQIIFFLPEYLGFLVTLVLFLLLGCTRLGFSFLPAEYSASACCTAS